MKRWYLLLIALILLLSACGSKTPVDPTGQWDHTERQAYMSIQEEDDGQYTVYLEATRGNAAQIASATTENVTLSDGKAKFPYEDSFGNSGTVYLTVEGSEISLRYETNQPYQGGWCVDNGAGTYRRRETDTARLYRDENDVFHFSGMSNIGATSDVSIFYLDKDADEAYKP